MLPLLLLLLEEAGTLLGLVEMNGLQALLKNGVKLPLSQLSNGKSLTLYLHLAVLLEGKLDGAHEGKILYSCSFFTVLEGKPCAVNYWSCLIALRPCAGRPM